MRARVCVCVKLPRDSNRCERCEDAALARRVWRACHGSWHARIDRPARLFGERMRNISMRSGNPQRALQRRLETQFSILKNFVMKQQLSSSQSVFQMFWIFCV